jgi:sucrose-6-phosphate hydrolase SacC (GH32 family)
MTTSRRGSWFSLEPRTLTETLTSKITRQCQEFDKRENAKRATSRNTSKVNNTSKDTSRENSKNNSRCSSKFAQDRSLSKSRYTGAGYSKINQSEIIGESKILDQSKARDSSPVIPKKSAHVGSKLFNEKRDIFHHPQSLVRGRFFSTENTSRDHSFSQANP